MAKVSSSRGKSQERSVKKRPKCRFPIRKRGTRPKARVWETEIEILAKAA